MRLTDIIKSYDCFSIHMGTDNDGYLTNCDNGDVFEINKTTKLIFEQCNGELSLHDIFKSLKKYSDDSDFEVSEQDILDLATFFVENQICYIV